LLVDDSALVRRMVRKRVGRDVEIIEASSVHEARAVGAGDCDLALLDLELGDGTGVDVARVVLEASPTCRVAFFTTAAASELADQARVFGPVFEKPHDLADAVAWLHAT
jgi:DNA-binding NarL/FixJ family response regulator